MSSDASSTKERIAKVRTRVETVRDRAQRTLPWQVWERMLEIEFVDRGVALAGKAFVSFFPLVIVVAAFLPASIRSSIFSTLTHRLGIEGSALNTAKQAFASAKDVRRATGILGLDLHLLLRRIVHHRHPARLPPGLATRPGGKVGEYTRGPMWLAAILIYMATLGGVRGTAGQQHRLRVLPACSRSP